MTRDISKDEGSNVIASRRFPIGVIVGVAVWLCGVSFGPNRPLAL